MGFFRQTGVKILIVVILVPVVGSTTAYLLKTQQNQPGAFSRPTLSSRAPTGTHFSLTIVQPSLTSLPTSIGQTTTTTSWKTYTHSQYKLSFYYPPNYIIGIDNDFEVTFKGKDKTYDIEIRFNSPQAPLDNVQQNQTFSDFAAGVVMNDSKASGVNGQFYCDKVVQQTPLLNPYGLTGYKFYFHCLDQKLGGTSNKPVWETVNEAIVGPVLAYDIT